MTQTWGPWEVFHRRNGLHTGLEVRCWGQGQGCRAAFQDRAEVGEAEEGSRRGEAWGSAECERGQVGAGAGLSEAGLGSGRPGPWKALSWGPLYEAFPPSLFLPSKPNPHWGGREHAGPVLS